MRDAGRDDAAQLVDDLYEAACGEKNWSDVLNDIRVLFGASSACIYRHGPELSPLDAFRTDSNPQMMQHYMQEFANNNELSSAVHALPVGGIFSDHEIVGRHRMRRTRVWNEWMAPQDMYGGLTSKILASDGSFWVFDMQRGRTQSGFDDGDAALLGSVVPHIARAVKIFRNRQITGMMSQVFSQLPFGVILVDPSLRILKANEMAQEILDLPLGPLRARAGRLRAGNPLDRVHLQDLVARACARTADGLPGTGGDHVIKGRLQDPAATDLVVTVTPLVGQSGSGPALEPCAAVYLRRLTLDLPARFDDYIRLLYRLSPREAIIAARLASGLSLKDAAAMEGIAMSTARTYMEHLFQKTGTHQQSALVALLKSLYPISNSG